MYLGTYFWPLTKQDVILGQSHPITNTDAYINTHTHTNKAPRKRTGFYSRTVSVILKLWVSYLANC